MPCLKMQLVGVEHQTILHAVASKQGMTSKAVVHHRSSAFSMLQAVWYHICIGCKGVDVTWHVT